MFEIVEKVYATAALEMRYHLTPWDVPTVGAPVATISSIAVRDANTAHHDFVAFRDWCAAESVVLVSCRLSHDQLAESGFLESQNFRFIELNYRPEMAGLQASQLREPDGLTMSPALPGDESTIAGIAAQIFEAGRFHKDPMIDARIGDERYRRWVTNAFRNPRQSVLTCSHEGRIQGFFVVESPELSHRFWSLVGLAPGLRGQGLGQRIWRAALRWHRDEGVDFVSTSISSLNVAAFNLYVKLGFRFPLPTMTFHWCPRGRVGSTA